MPGKNVKDETDARARYFIYVALHEVAHAFKKHKSPIFDNLTMDEFESQEKEADEIAMTWFNEHVKKRYNQYLLPPKIGDLGFEHQHSGKTGQRKWARLRLRVIFP